MTKKEYKITIPQSPDSINIVATYNKTFTDIIALKKKWQKIAAPIINIAIENGELPKRFKGVVEFFFELYFETKQSRDEDNYYLAVKGMVDAFRNIGLVEDDDHDHVHQNGLRIYHDKDRPRTEIYITEIYGEDTTKTRPDKGKSGVGVNRPGTSDDKKDDGRRTKPAPSSDSPATNSTPSAPKTS